MGTTTQIINNFFCLTEDGEVRKILLTQNVVKEVRNLFVNAGEEMLHDAEKIKYNSHDKLVDNEVFYVDILLEDEITEAVKNPSGTPNLDLKKEMPKTLFWVEGNKYYFQNFDKRKMLNNKSVLFFSNQTYTKLTEDAFVIDNVVNAVHENEQLYFTSYFNANRIFNLIEFYQEASKEDIEEFAKVKEVSLDLKWYLDEKNTNTNIRKQINLLHKSGILKNANTKQIKKDAGDFKLEIELDSKGEIKFPNDKTMCKEILLFLNEQYWTGLISGQKYKTNTKRQAIKIE